MVEKILLATDGSKTSLRAAEYAVDMAARYRAELIILHVVAKAAVPEEFLQFVESDDVENPPAHFYLEKVGLKIIDQCKSAAQYNGCENAETMVVQGDPAHEILETAKDKKVDVIVMGSRGLGYIMGGLLGSVTRKVTHYAECTCIIVK